MTFINPITGAVLPAAQAQERLAADKARQIREQQVARRVTAPSAADRFEHVVESAEVVAGVRDERSRGGRHRPPTPRRKGPKVTKPADEPPALDVRG